MARDNKVGGSYGVPESSAAISQGMGQVTLYNKKAGIYLAIPVNPSAIK